MKTKHYLMIGAGLMVGYVLLRGVPGMGRAELRPTQLQKPAPADKDTRA